MTDFIVDYDFYKPIKGFLLDMSSIKYAGCKMQHVNFRFLCV